MTRYTFLAEAEREYLDAIKFYEDQKVGLGAALIHEFERIIEFAIKKPESWRQVHPLGVRRINLSKFPYAIFYRVLPGGIQITAFAHHRRQPGYWQKRIS